MSDSQYFPDEKMRLDVLEANRLSRKIKARGGRMMAVEVIFKAGAVGYEHQHEHEQISYCLDGEFVFTVDGRNYPLKVGDSVYIPPSAVHGARCLADGRILDIFTPQREDFLNA